MQTTRAQIVEYLKEHGRASVSEFVEATGLTSMTIRHHLAVLETEGMISSRKERGHVGRPRHVYVLTDDALSLFPERYDQLAERLMAGLKALGVKREINQVLKHMGAEVALDYDEELNGKSVEERLDLLIDILGDQGFLASWEKRDEEYVLTEYSCPYLLVGHEHPEICQVDWQIITNILHEPVKRKTCMLHGDTNCTFRIAPAFDVAIADIN